MSRRYSLAVVLLAACGGASHAAEPVVATDCKIVVTRYDMVDADLKASGSRFDADDLVVIGKAFANLERITASAATDFGAMKPSDARLSAFVGDTATYARSLQQSSHDASASIERLTSASASSKRILAGIKERAAAVAVTCRDSKPPECGRVLEWIEKMPEDDAALETYVPQGREIVIRDPILKQRFGDLLDDFATILTNTREAKSANDGFQKLVKELDADKRGDALDERLRVLCGRPIPPKKQATPPS